MKYEVDYDIAPERGEIVLFDGREFEVVGYEAVMRRDGTGGSIIHWNTRCSVCEKPIKVTTGFRAKTITKRCEEHRARGVPATKAAAKRKAAWRYSK